MKRMWLFSLALAAYCAGWANDAGPYYSQCAVLKKVGAASKAPSTRPAALAILEKIAEGASPGKQNDLEKAIGMKLDDFDHVVYRQAGVRACALRILGATALPEAIDFLTDFKPPDGPGIEPEQLWPARDIALQEARLLAIADGASRARFLDEVLSAPHNRRSNAAVTFWAANELCNAGAASSLTKIRPWMKRSWPGPEGEKLAQFCEARIEVLSRNPDRARALGTVFDETVRLEGNPQGQELLRWAAVQLAILHSTSAAAEIERVSAGLATAQRSFPEDAELAAVIKEIGEIFAANRVPR